MKKILIIDDEPTILQMMKRMISKQGYDVHTALNGEDGLALIEQNTIDLVITDIIMPKKEGMELITGIKKNFPGIKIIAMSGGGRFSPEGYLHSANILGANKIFKKPFDHHEMHGAIKELIGE